MLKICVMDWQTYLSLCDTVFDDTSLRILHKMHDRSLCDTPDDMYMENQFCQGLSHWWSKGVSRDRNTLLYARCEFFQTHVRKCWVMSKFQCHCSYHWPIYLTRAPHCSIYFYAILGFYFFFHCKAWYKVEFVQIVSFHTSERCHFVFCNM